MDETGLKALRDDLAKLPVPAIVTELPKATFVIANDRAADLFGAPASQLVGTDVASHLHPTDRDAAENALAAIASRTIDGYQARRLVVRPDGTEVPIRFSGRRVDTPGGPFGLFFIIPDDNEGDLTEFGEAADVVLGLTDHDWMFEFVSSDADLLGSTGRSLVGTPLLGLVHPSAAAEFLAAASRAVSGQMAITIFTRLYCRRNGWSDRYCLMLPMCEHDPPRMGIVITKAPLGRADSTSLHPHAHHAVVEARAVEALQALPALTKHPQGAELSARQIEIVSRLIAGDGVDDIAGSLYLSQSTVRNHLSAIYRKFGVHSRAELLASLLRAASPDDSEQAT